MLTPPFPRRPIGALALGFAVLCLPACNGDDDDDDNTGPQKSGFGGTLGEDQEVPAPITGSRVRVTVTNRAPDLGTFQTPVWVAFHDGSFDLHDPGSAAATYFPGNDALERLAEDGATEPLDEAFAASPAGVVSGVLAGQLGPEPGPIAPGETVSAVFELNGNDPTNRYFSYASMVIPSNDAFVADGSPTAHEVFDSSGAFVAADFSVTGAEVLDAGTEVNDELPANTAFFGQTTPDTGVDENGVVAAHPGFLPPGSGGILDDPGFAAADFTVPGYEMLAFTFELLPPAGPAAGVAAVELKDGGNTVEFTISATGLSGRATAAHFHRGAVGVAGPVLIDLGSAIVVNEAGQVLLQGSSPTTAEFRNQLRAGNVYVNIHTNLNPSGEVRGQLATVDAFLGKLDMAQEVPTPVLGTDVRVTVRNRAPALGTFQTPVWIAFHDGGFDIYDLGQPANAFFPTTNALERLAEDGNTDPIGEDFATMPFGSIQGVLQGPGLAGPIAPGETVSTSFRVEGGRTTSRYLSYATMIIPSNDAFLANGDPLAHEVFDAGGAFVGADFDVPGTAALDAGTEVNDELPQNTAFFGQTTPNTGTDEGGVVALHPGFLPPGSGGILDDPMFANADFTVPGYEFLEVRLDQLDPGAAPTGVIAASLSPAGSDFAFALAVHGLSGPATELHFHQGAVGVAGPVLVDLAESIEVNSDGVLFAADVLPFVDSAFLDALFDGSLYVNVHTALNPQGEVRGQVVLVK